MKKILFPLISQLLIYGVQYLILPSIIYISPADAMRNKIVIIVSSAIFSFLSMFYCSDKFRYWLVGILLYFIAVIIYHPTYVYGIGYGMFSLEIASILVITALVLATEFIIWVIVKSLKRIKGSNSFL